MVIFVKPNGETIAENQLLSVGAKSGRVSIVAPSRPGAFVEMLVKTPTGELLEPIYAAPVLSISAEDIGLYTCGIVPRMTSAAGRVEYQLSFAYEGGEKEVTPMGTFVVQPGNIVLPPDEPTKSMYDEIKNAMIAASANYADVILHLDKALEAVNSVEVNMEIISAAKAEALAASDLSASNANVSEANAKTAQGYAEQANIAANRAENALGALGNIKPEEAVNAHNVNTNAHSDIRALILDLAARLAAFLNSDDITLDQTKEIVAYIKSNRGLIESITTEKVSVIDIVNDLATNSTTKPLSAAQGVKLKQLIDGLVVTETDPTVPAWAKQPNKPTYTASEVDAIPTDKLPEAISEALAEAKASGDFDGKSAYDYAKDGGYTGTEEEFAEDMAEFPVVSEEMKEIIEQDVLLQYFVDSVDEMTDKSKKYVLKSTGTVWENKVTTTEKEITVTDTIENAVDNPYHDNTRLGSSATSFTDGFTTGATGYHLTPLIDLTKYSGKTIQLHLEGANYVNETQATYITHRAYAPDGSIVYVRGNTTTEANYLGAWTTAKTTINSDTSAIIEIDAPLLYGSENVEIGYLRFCGKGAVADSNIYITYSKTETFVVNQWVDTGRQFGYFLGGVDKETFDKISALNNEGVSPSTIKLLPKPVLDFYNTEAYTDGDYSYSHLSAVTYPCRADIPVPFMVKWEHNENAMRTTVAVDDTKVIGTLNRFTMRTYDATGRDMFPIYNLLPNHTYYYKVTHVMADGSLVEAKSGSFTTSSEPWRLIYIDGTQNVRGLGGWTGLNGKKVKYGKIFRGAAFSDSSYPELILTGKGKRALGDLDIQAELNLGAADTETSIAANCVYTKIGYSSYTNAITNETNRGHFKTALEWIVTQLKSSKPIYMHCQGGCDRTGTLAFQLLGLLGVSESDLAKEYELSSFSDIGLGRYRNSATYDYSGMVQAIKTYSGTTITDKFVSFATDCGVSTETIDSFRNLMLE